MRLFLTLAVTLGCAANAHAGTNTGAHADTNATKKVYREPNIKILSFQELMRLSSKKRMAYIRDLRKVLIAMEDRSSSFETAAADGELMHEKIARLIRLMEFAPEAEAAEVTPAPSSALDQPMAGRPNWVDGRGWSCADSGLIFNKRLGTCVLGSEEGATTIYGGGPCPAGAKKVADPDLPMLDNYWVCIPKTSWDLLTATTHGPVGVEGRQEQIAKKQWLPDGYFDGKSKEQTQPTVAGQDPGVVNTDVGVHASKDQPVAPTSVVAPADLPANVKAPVDGASEDVTCGESAFTCKDIYDLKKSGGAAYKAAAAQVTAFRADRSNDVCISGGFFSHYKTKEKRKGSCKIVTAFPDGSRSPCKANEALCNPILFCLATDIGGGKKFPHEKCVPYGRKAGYDLTRRCNAWYEEVRTSGKDDLVRGGKTYPGVPTTTCDPGKGDVTFGDVGLQEEWNKMKSAMDEHFGKFCMPQTGDAGFQALYCTECKAMAAIRARAVGGCKGGVVNPDAAPAPGAVPEGKDIKPGGPAPAVPESEIDG